MPIRRFLLRPLEFPAVQRLLRPSLRGAMPIFMFHRFAQPDLGIHGHSPSELRKQLAALRRNGVRFVSLPALARDEHHAPRGPRIAFTVDDGYTDFKDVALPIFQEFDCPVSVFVSTSVIDGDTWYWWDQLTYVFTRSTRTEISVSVRDQPVTYRLDRTNRERIAADLTELFKNIPHDVRLDLMAHIAASLEVDLPAVRPPEFSPMTWDDIAACAATGVASFGPHTLTHPSLPQTTEAVARKEMIGSWERLKQRTSDPLPIFCYPFGIYSRREVDILETTEMVGAITTDPRYAARAPFERSRGARRFTVPRFAYPDNAEQFLQVAIGFERLKMVLREGRSGWDTDSAS